MDVGIEDSKPGPNSPRISRRFSNGMRASLVVLETGALEIHEDHITRSIGGRLSGSIRTFRLADLDAVAAFDEEIDTEGTHLLKLGGPAASPSLKVWIFPALTCASAYAFYNIFIKKGKVPSRSSWNLCWRRSIYS